MTLCSTSTRSEVNTTELKSTPKIRICFEVVYMHLLGVGGGVTGFNIASIVTAVIGAVVLLAVLRVVRRA